MWYFHALLESDQVQKSILKLSNFSLSNSVGVEVYYIISLNIIIEQVTTTNGTDVECPLYDHLITSHIIVQQKKNV